MAKENFSIRISPTAKKQLHGICEVHKRKTGNMLEVLIDTEFKRLKLTLPPEEPAPKKP